MGGDVGFFDPISGEMQVGGLHSSGFGEGFTEARPGKTKGRKKCTACGKLPGDMAEHWKRERDTHGPMSTSNPEALRNLPGLDDLSQHLGGIFSDRRS